MHRKHVHAIRRSLIAVPSRRNVLRGIAGAGLVALLGWPHDSDVAAKAKRKRRKKKTSSPPQSPSPPPPFNQFGCLDVGQPCQGDSTLCCSGICDPGTSSCIAHHSGVCFPDTDTCTTGQEVRCHPQKERCFCLLTTGNAGFCADFGGATPAQICRFCSTDTDCQEEFGPGAACVVLKGICSAACASTGRTACMRPCA